MRQIIIRGYGGPEVLTLVEAPMPEPGPGEVRIRVTAAGVAFGDVLWRTGALPVSPKLPFVPGYDVVGIIDKLGPSVEGLSLGDRVGTLVGLGGYSEYVCAPADGLVPVPKAVTDVDAVAAVLNYGTAYQLLFRSGRVHRGDSILVPGAGGGVGTAMLQLAAREGVRAIGAASERHHELIKELCGEPITNTPEDLSAQIMALTGGRGVDVAFEQTGGSHLWRS